MACLFDDGRATQQALEQTVYNAYAKAVRESLCEVVRKECVGCQIDHPSQKQHEVCLLMSFDEKVDYFLEEALKQVDEMRVMQEWVTEVETLFPAQDISHILLQEFRWDLSDLDIQGDLGRLASLIKENEKNKT